ncbi:hypothetical protein C2E23DRAFT_897736 [Lenzites betulinus]|nr:hypothetical protein C2E23DRAFT_897736 [Lenzites betulinus]
MQSSQTYKGAVSSHLRLCYKAIFLVQQHPLSNQGPSTNIQRGSDGLIICRCLDQGRVCTKKFLNKHSLFKHLKAVKHDLWQMPVASSTLPSIPEEYSTNQTPMATRPDTPTTPPHSPRPMSLILSPGGSNSSRISIDPNPFVPPPSELYDVADGTLATWGLLINHRLKALLFFPPTSLPISTIPTRMPTSNLVKRRLTKLSNRSIFN